MKHTPVHIFELKRPQRSDSNDPVQQIIDYAIKIRDGRYTDLKGRPINVNTNTPIYGYVVCDLTDDMRKICLNHSLTASPDNKGYYGYHKGHEIYFEILSFDKLIGDSYKRNKVFFNKLGIE